MSVVHPALVLAAAGGWQVWLAVGVAALAVVPVGLRWLRVAQREHYLADAVSRFAVRWWTSEPLNALAALVGLAGVGLAAVTPLAALATAAVGAIAPAHLSLRGRTSRLVFTRRMRTLAVVWLVLQAAVVLVGVAVGAPAPFLAAGLMAAPALVDVALLATWPLERHLGERFVRSAAARLATVSPTVVAVTGSYGKTSTKNHIAHLVAGCRTVVATPASFNNRAGLARSVNEHLIEGTEVFVAEMGTYGPGEIRDLCSWCAPEIAVITAIGPVHLERFGSQDAIASAKAEITEQARVVVLNVDDPHLHALADRLAARPDAPAVLRCSAADPSADVCVRPGADGLSVTARGEPVVSGIALHEAVRPTNLACALAVALRLGVPAAELAARIPTLPAVANRLASGIAASGVYVIDDTFNSNPAGARAALSALERAPGAGRRVIVTPGMVELGVRQAIENEAFAREGAAVATTVVVVGRTNRRALVRGATGRAPVVWVRTREAAVAWVRSHLGPGDAVLYENDLPDHYP